MTRISLVDSFDNKDVISQIYRLREAVDHGTYRNVDVERDGNNIVFTFTRNDDSTEVFQVPDEGIVDVTGTAQGSQVTITFEFADGTTKDFTYTATGGVTIDTDQTIAGMKVFSAASTNFSHDVDVGADLNVGGTVKANELTVDTDATVDGTLEVGGDAKITGKLTDNVVISQGHTLELENAGVLEPSGSDLVISPGSRLLVKCSNGQDLELVVASTGVIVDKVTASTSANVPDTPVSTRSTAAVNGNRLQDDLDAYGAMVRTTGNQFVNGIKVPQVMPMIKRIYVRNDSLTSNWVRICSFDANSSFGDFHMITRFLSANTENLQGSINFRVDIMQRIEAGCSGRGIALIDNACQLKPLAVGIAGTPGSVNGLKMISDSDDGTIELWGTFTQKRILVMVESFVRINNLPSGVPVVKEDMEAVGIDDRTVLDSVVSWDMQTFSSVEPVGARANSFILKGEEVTQ